MLISIDSLSIDKLEHVSSLAEISKHLVRGAVRLMNIYSWL